MLSIYPVMSIHFVFQFLFGSYYQLLGFPGGSVGKNPYTSAGDEGLIPGSGRSEKEWQPTPGFLPGEFHGQRSLVSYHP